MVHFERMDPSAHQMFAGYTPCTYAHLHINKGKHRYIHMYSIHTCNTVDSSCYSHYRGVVSHFPRDFEHLVAERNACQHTKKKDISISIAAAALFHAQHRLQAQQHLVFHVDSVCPLRLIIVLVKALKRHHLLLHTLLRQIFQDTTFLFVVSLIIFLLQHVSHLCKDTTKKHVLCFHLIPQKNMFFVFICGKKHNIDDANWRSSAVSSTGPLLGTEQ